jgi:hypothetical protein
MSAHPDCKVRQYSAKIMEQISADKTTLDEMPEAAGALFALTTDANAHTKSLASTALKRLLDHKSGEQYMYALEQSLAPTHATPSDRLNIQSYEAPSDAASTLAWFAAEAGFATAATAAIGYGWGPLRVWLKEAIVDRSLTVDRAKQVLRTVGPRTAIGSTALFGYWWVVSNLAGEPHRRGWKLSSLSTFTFSATTAAVLFIGLQRFPYALVPSLVMPTVVGGVHAVQHRRDELYFRKS